MNEGTNNEIDLLLRKLGRRERSAQLSDSATLADEGHLDADELNAYAEDSLPVAARAVYTEHLADCIKCRRLVAQLSLTSGATVPQEQPTSKRPSPFGTFLRNLLSPLTWRYAIPTLAAIAILAVAVVVLRRQPTRELVAQNPGPIVGQSVQSAEKAVSEPTNKQDGAVDQLQTSTKQTDAVARKSKDIPQAPVEKDTEASGDDSRRQGGEAKKEEAAERAAAQPPPAAAPVTTAPPKTAVTGNAVASSEVAQAKKQPANEPQAAREEDQSAARVADKKSEAVTVTRAPARDVKALGGAGRLRGDLSAGAVARARNDKENAEEETRNIAGHRFRKQGNSWVDVDYSSGRSTVNISRGSEQYRALVADEPGIRTIADELDGEVIVVWKSRAYRIH